MIDKPTTLAGDQIGRLALRHEGNFWNAYYALPDTMHGAVLIGSIAMTCVRTQERKEAFMELMKLSIGDIIAERRGIKVEWPNEVQQAPENERSGHG